MKKYSIKNFSTNRLFTYSVIAFILVISLTILTSKYIGVKIYPAITFLVASTLSILWIKNNCWNIYRIDINENYISINDKSYKLTDIRKYTFNENEKFYGFRLFIKSYQLFLSIPKKDSLDYSKFKKEFTEIIKEQNQKEDSYKIIKYNWYKTKSAKVYGYMTICILLGHVSELVMSIFETLTH